MSFLETKDMATFGSPGDLPPAYREHSIASSDRSGVQQHLTTLVGDRVDLAVAQDLWA